MYNMTCGGRWNRETWQHETGQRGTK